MAYKPSYFDELADDSLSSARTVVPLLLDRIQPTSVVDVGCATGAWLSVFQECGIERIMGLDGSYIDRSKLLVPAACFRAVDLAKPFHFAEEFDLAVCLEVAEHLPKAAAKGLVQSLCSLAPIVLFSAAVPGQRGLNHVNEQWPEYWRQLFAQQCFRMFDPLRPLLWHNDYVAYYYRQNTFLFISERCLAEQPHLSRLPEVMDESALLIVPPRMVIDNMGFRNVLQQLPRIFLASVRRRLGRRRR